MFYKYKINKLSVLRVSLEYSSLLVEVVGTLFGVRARLPIEGEIDVISFRFGQTSNGFPQVVECEHEVLAVKNTEPLFPFMVVDEIVDITVSSGDLGVGGVAVAERVTAFFQINCLRGEVQSSCRYFALRNCLGRCFAYDFVEETY